MIIDEAHHLDPLFREAFTQSYGKEEMLHLVKSCANGTLQSRSLITSTVHDIVALFRLFRDEINAQQSDTDGDTSAYYFNCTPHIRELLGKIKHRLPKIEEDDELSELYHFLRKAYHNAEDSIIWLEDHGGIRLCICKKDIRSDIRTCCIRSAEQQF